MIYLSSLEGQPLYLEGEIDALATTGKLAYLIDYKTGGSASETADHVRDKHLFQAQCYACALLQAGYEQVRAVFVRVEQLANPEAVHYVEYLFTEADIASLEEEILAKWSAIL